MSEQAVRDPAGNRTPAVVFASRTVCRIVVLEAGMIRMSQAKTGHAERPSWVRRADIPMPLILAWIAALVITTEGLMTLQNLYG